jgi:hypothetical protein
MRRGRQVDAAALGLAVALAYLVGAALSGSLSPLARRPLLDGFAPPPPYRWVRPPPALAASNKPPSRGRAVVRLTASGSEVTAVATDDGQANLLLLGAGAVPSSPGQRSVTITLQPLDPATLGPVPAGLLVVGNAYRVRAVYQPSGTPVTLGGGTTVALVYPLLSVPVSSPFAYIVLTSKDGMTWTRQPSHAAPAVHQVTAPLGGGSYAVVAVPPGHAGQAAARHRVVLIGLAVAVLLATVAVAWLGRRLATRRSTGAGGEGGRRR